MYKTVQDAIHMITKNGGKVGSKFVALPNGDKKTIKTITHKNPGIKVLGAIDYLVSKGYTWLR